MIHEKKVKLKELRNLASKLLSEAEIHFRRLKKMRISEIKEYDWKNFSAEDDMRNMTDEYCFISMLKDDRLKQKISSLLTTLFENEIARSFFSKEMCGKRIYSEKTSV